MTARNYDFVITVDNAAGFQSTNVLIGNTSAAVGVIANVDTSLNTLKVKLSNSILEFSNLEVVHSMYYQSLAQLMGLSIQLLYPSNQILYRATQQQLLLLLKA